MSENTISPLIPENFDAHDYVEQMRIYMGLHIDPFSIEEVSKFIEVAHQMAKIVYATPLDDNHIDLANVFIPGMPE